MCNYPNEFLNEIKEILNEDYDLFFKSIDKPPFKGLRVNTLKCSINDIINNIPCNLENSPFFKDGYYITNNGEKLGNNPLHLAGAFYLQEPSAMSAVTLLDVKPGDRVLDLCAAPGGKSTQIASILDGKGLLWSNEIKVKRAEILLSNIERMGVKNAIVSHCHPEILCNKLNGFFDKVLVDAPCSGEGMFRKDKSALLEWGAEHVKSCSNRQLQILNTAASAVKPGGVLVYSTCTFSRLENEEVINKFLKENSNFELANTDINFGRSYLKGTVRIFPMDGGEGHFCAKLVKRANARSTDIKYLSEKQLANTTEIKKYYKEIFQTMPFGEKIYIKNDKVYLLPENIPDISGLSVMRAGVLLGEIKKNRLEPSHCAFMASKPNACNNHINFAVNSDILNSFLQGQEIPIDIDIKGYTAVCVNGITIGFGKAVDGRLKNKYPKGLRLNG